MLWYMYSIGASVESWQGNTSWSVMYSSEMVNSLSRSAAILTEVPDENETKYGHISVGRLDIKQANTLGRSFRLEKVIIRLTKRCLSQTS